MLRLENLKEDNSSLIWSYIGSQMLDFYLLDDYYIKAGRFDKDKIVDYNVQFGVKLATSNQRIFKIARVKE